MGIIVRIICVEERWILRGGRTALIGRGRLVLILLARGLRRGRSVSGVLMQ